MDDKKQQTTFGDLPQPLVKELLDKVKTLGKTVGQYPTLIKIKHIAIFQEMSLLSKLARI